MEFWESFLPDRGDAATAGVGPSLLLQQRKEEEARRALLNPAIMALWAAGQPDPAGPELLRAIVEEDQWTLPLDPSGACDILEVKAGKYRLALPAEGGGSIRKATRRDGRGGRLLPVHAGAPSQRGRALNGRTLVRELPPDIDGLLLHFEGEPPVELPAEHFTALGALATACDVEDLLAAPAPGQVQGLLDAVLLTPMNGGELAVDATFDEGPLVGAYTHADRVGYCHHPARPMGGREFLQRLAHTPAAAGAVINHLQQVGRGATAVHGFVLAVGEAIGLLEGRDVRPGAAPLPAQTRGEVELWLELRGFPTQGRTLIDAPYPDQVLLRAHAPGPTRWRLRERVTRPDEEHGDVWSPVFVLPPGGERDAGFGPEPSRILCAGLLARALGAAAYEGKDAEHFWRRGRHLGLRRLLDAQDQDESRRRVALGRELHKLLPADGDVVPRSAILTVAGGAILHRAPHGATRAWIETTVEVAQRYTGRWGPP